MGEHPCAGIDRLMCTNVGDKRLREKGQLLLIGTCMMSRHPDIVQEYQERDGGYVVLEVCLEETHANQSGFKIGSMVRYADLRKLTVLTVDGSPHCVQLHFIVEDIKKHFTPEIETDHFVVERGEVHKISPKAVKKARHLSKIQSLLNQR